MEPSDLIDRLLAAGCRLTPEGERLRVRDPQKALTDELRALIRHHKAAILDRIRHDRRLRPEDGQGASVSSSSSPAPSAPPRSHAEQPTAPAPRQDSAGPMKAGGTTAAPGQPPSPRPDSVGPSPANPHQQRSVPPRETSGPTPAPAPQRPRDLRASGHMGDDATLELAQDRVLQPFVEAQSAAWKREHLVCRYDRHHGYVMGFTAPALEALLQYVESCSAFGSAADRDHYIATVRWRIEHGVRRLAHTSYRPAPSPEVLPNQLDLF